jgi:hypothetical protein
MLKCKGTVLLALAMGLLGCTKEYTTKEYNTYNTYNNTYDSEYYSTVLASQTEITTDIRPPYLQKGDTCHFFRFGEWHSPAQVMGTGSEAG